MNTDTPKTDQWETYCDECYYHMWRLRRKNERGWHDGFHIHTGEEAKGLCDLLNNLERELAEARGRTDDDDTGKSLARLIRQRDEAKRQRDRLAEALLSVIDEDGTPMSIDRANEILQSLTTT